MLFPVIFRFQKKARKTSCKLLAPENPPEKIKNLTGKCSGGRVFAVSGHFPFSEKGQKNELQAAGTGKSTGKIKNLTGKCPGGRVFAVSGHFPFSEKGRKNELQAAGTGKSTGKSQKPDRKMPWRPRICCFRWIFRCWKWPQKQQCDHRDRKKRKT
ncbi:hypothetical protein CSC41_5931 [Pseudomonas aeruginosa]|nr:hypothetical protein CSC41_5931 [Pseudomonas aeruginosa]